jgi:hypothetical protein
VLDILSDDPDCDLLMAKTSLQNTFPIHYLRTLKPARTNWKSLREKSVQFQASMADATVTEILVTRDQKPGGGGGGSIALQLTQPINPPMILVPTWHPF